MLSETIVKKEWVLLVVLVIVGFGLAALLWRLVEPKLDEALASLMDGVNIITTPDARSPHSKNTEDIEGGIALTKLTPKKKQETAVTTTRSPTPSAAQSVPAIKKQLRGISLEIWATTKFQWARVMLNQLCPHQATMAAHPAIWVCSTRCLRGIF
jgi:hypothetical protein